jgi:hypothetical protein
MITEKDLQEAIAECKGTRNPNASTCIKLAAYYTILDNLYPKEERFEDIPRNDAVMPLFQSESEFISICSGKDIKAVLGVLNEHLEAIKLLYPKEYNSIIEKIREL